MNPRRQFICFYAASGAAALVYEVAWTRLLTLLMGHTVAAATTVLAAFMGGLATGAWLAGRSPIQPSRRLQTYATLEIFVALVAIALPVIFRAFLPTLSWAYADGDTPNRFVLVRLVLSLAVVGLPAAAMGATFPIAAAWFASTTTGMKSRPVTQSAAEVGLLYAANSTGAIVGALGAGFFLIPTLGLRGTIWIGVSLNGIAALGALRLARRDTAASAKAGQAASEDPKGSKRGSSRGAHSGSSAAAKPQPILACAGIALSGFLALVYEVGWTRLLELVVGPTTYAFAIMVASFIVGIAIGSAVGARVARHVLQPALWLAAMLVLAGSGASLAAWFAASRLPLLVASQVARSNVTFWSVMAQEVFSVALLLLPTTVALGAAFSFALSVAASETATVARDTARVYAANTLGAIAGALAGGFLLVPRLGLHGTFVQMSRVAAVGGALCATLALVRRARTSRRHRAAILVEIVACGALAVLVNLPDWDREILASGAYLYARSIPVNARDAVLRAGGFEYYHDGAAATVSVRRLAGTLTLAIDGKVDASNGGDMLTQRLLGLLPAFLHGKPRDVCIIGLGTGVTAASILATGSVGHSDVVEISPEVAQASKFFSKENGDILRAPGVRLILGDGRSHLLLTRRKYDVIISEPSNPWLKGVASLFTHEFFEAARERLKPEGLMCQWTHTYDISAVDLKSIVHTFGSVFPQATIWLVGDADVLLIGTNGVNIESRLADIDDRWQAGTTPAALADVGVKSGSARFELLSLFVGGPRQLAQYSAGAPNQTDDRMALEFTSPRGIYGSATESNAAALRALAANGQLPRAVADALHAGTAEDWTARGGMALRANGFEMAYDSFRRAVALDIHNVSALRGASDAAAGAHLLDHERAWLQHLAAAAPYNVEVRVELSHLMAAEGDTSDSIAWATAATQLEPQNPLPLEQLASIYADEGDADRLEPLADMLVARFPSRKEGHFYHATALFLRGRTLAAAEEARQLVSKDPGNAKAQNLLGAAYAVVGQNESARIAFETSIRLNPRDPSAYVNLGVLSLQTADPAAAMGYFAEALTLDPSSATARSGFLQARQAVAGQ